MPTSKDSAGFVFEGTVRKIKAANLKVIKDRARTAVVRVDAIVRAPEVLMSHARRDVTVKLAKNERVRVGQTARFYTDGWIFGENLAVQSLGHERVTAAASAAAAEIHPAMADTQHHLRRQASDAHVVLSGRVIAIGEAEPPPVAAAHAAGAADSEARRPISEHDPFWTEAIVEVHTVHKGRTRKKRVVLRFPSSSDVHWQHAPKFQVGHEGVFMLHPDKVSKIPRVGAIAEAFDSKESFTCLHPVGFQSADCEAECDTVLRAVGAK